MQARVLIVEDQLDIAELYQLKLQLDGFLVAVADDGVVGLEVARTLLPDIIVLDVHLPRLDGLQLLAALREDESTRRLPVLVCSDDDSPDLRREADRLLAADYLVKAQTLPSRLSRTIRELLLAGPREARGAARRAS